MVEGGSYGGVIEIGRGMITGNDNNTLTGNQIRDRSDTTAVPNDLVFLAGSFAPGADSNNRPRFRSVLAPPASSMTSPRGSHYDHIVK